MCACACVHVREHESVRWTSHELKINIPHPINVSVHENNGLFLRTFLQNDVIIYITCLKMLLGYTIITITATTATIAAAATATTTTPSFTRYRFHANVGFSLV